MQRVMSLLDEADFRPAHVMDAKELLRFHQDQIDESITSLYKLLCRPTGTMKTEARESKQQVKQEKATAVRIGIAVCIGEVDLGFKRTDQDHLNVAGAYRCGVTS